MENIKQRIMLVDDSANLRSVIREWLLKESFDVFDFNDGESAVKAFTKGYYDMCILDIMMPGMDGFELLQTIRNVDRNLPVIILTACTGRDERIRGFQLGCDDYITKPFSIEELVLRMRAILRRCVGKPGSGVFIEERVYTFGDFTFNYSAMQLIHPAVTRTLTRKEAALLKLFCEHKNKLIPREIIMKEVWGEEDHAVSRSMDVFLTKLRSYLRVGLPETPVKHGRGRHKASERGEEMPSVEICNVHGTGFILRVRE